MPDSFTAALSRLDPASRALLDLSLRRGMRTEEIAELLGADPDSVAASRDEALRRVADDVGMNDTEQHLDEVRTRLAELPAAEWLGEAARATNGTSRSADPEAEPAVVAEPEAEAEPAVVAPAEAEPPEAAPAEPEAEPMAESPEREEPEVKAATPPISPVTPPLAAGARRRRPIVPVLLGLLLVGGVILVIALASGGDDEQAASPAPTGAAKPPPAQNGGGEPTGTPLEPVGSFAADAKGTATVEDGQLRVTVDGLPQLRDRDYVVWLYSSLIDSRNLANVRGTTIDLETKLPADWERYRFVDVSVEPRDGKPNVHSGESVMRVPTSDLR